MYNIMVTEPHFGLKMRGGVELQKNGARRVCNYGMYVYGHSPTISWFVRCLNILQSHPHSRSQVNDWCEPGDKIETHSTLSYGISSRRKEHMSTLDKNGYKKQTLVISDPHNVQIFMTSDFSRYILFLPYVGNSLS